MLWEICRLVSSKNLTVMKYCLTKKKHHEKNFYESIDITYQPVSEDSAILCFFTAGLYLAYRTYYSRSIKGWQCIIHPTARQCYYCDHYFVSRPVFEKHIKRCSNLVGIAYEFNNKKIISFQDNFRYMGDFPFTVYFDFETTTGDSVIDGKRMFVISYCQICAFHPALNVGKIVIFRSFQQNADEINSLDHFQQGHVKFFDPVTIKHVRHAATNAISRKKTTSLSEFFSVELKFTIDTLTKWFN